MSERVISKITLVCKQTGEGQRIATDTDAVLLESAFTDAGYPVGMALIGGEAIVSFKDEKPTFRRAKEIFADVANDFKATASATMSVVIEERFELTF